MIKFLASCLTYKNVFFGKLFLHFGVKSKISFKLKGQVFNKFKRYDIYALVNPFIGRQPVYRSKIFFDMC